LVAPFGQSLRLEFEKHRIVVNHQHCWSPFRKASGRRK
jgi:hypothetical protein